MNRFRIPVLLAALTAAVALVACGGSDSSTAICDSAASAYSSLNTKVGSCQVTGLPISFDKGVCQKNLNACSSGEQDTMKRYFDCLNNVSTCQAGNEQAWIDEVNACQSNTVISSGCAGALNPM